MSRSSLPKTKAGREAEINDLIQRLMQLTNHGSDFIGAIEQGAFLGAVLGDEHASNDPLSASAQVLIQNYLSELCERSDIHAWNDGLLARVLWPIFIGIGDACTDDFAFRAVLAGVKSMSTDREYAEFLKRHALTDEDPAYDEAYEDWTTLVQGVNLLVMKEGAAETRQDITEQIILLCASLDITPTHPALLERTLDVMQGAAIRQGRKAPAYLAFQKLLKTIRRSTGGAR